MWPGEGRSHPWTSGDKSFLWKTPANRQARISFCKWLARPSSTLVVMHLSASLPLQDDWDVEEFVSKVCMGRFLNHPIFKITLAALIISNALTIASRTEMTIEEKYYGLFSAIDNIVLTVLTCEVLLNWYYGFWMYWKDGWNIINFCIVHMLMLTTLLFPLRVMRLIQVCTQVEGLARMIRVILQSIPDMANIMILLFSIMLVFSVFGVTLFGNLVPMHFGNLETALYSLFICLTQDGWMNIYKNFEEEGIALKIGGGLYFFVFITGGAFICTNLLVAVLTSNLEQTMVTYTEEKQKRNQLLHLDKYMGLETPLIYSNLGNLTEATCEDFCLVLEGIQENLNQYKEIRDELNLCQAAPNQQASALLRGSLQGIQPPQSI
uniref:Cation channel sperm associated 4 n=1 Tax=Pelusios castaneus TaxID=367368 RepID=A0A8C8RAJ5_9SAUR